MENSDQETLATVASATPPLSTSTDVNVTERHPKKKKLYRQHFLALLERCEIIQQDNERLVHRIHQVAKQLRRIRLERRFIMDRLDTHKDNWREAELKIDLGTDLPLPEAVNLKNQGIVETPNGKKNLNIKSTEKKDPNLPKRPANPFFRFCQEQRPIVLDQIIMSGEGEPTKQDLTKRLAITWNTMEHNDKKVYYDMYEKFKEKYAADMEEYTLNKSINTVQTSNFSSSQ
ncbi:non-histone protein 10 [Acyrthosiphon pisum]|uniref:ACYPI010120 protein n=1 Tax=Acyrthosiphon pisum TaxID=7029 RepID=C4WW64_ACYPI|nr:non-histone protein 10 [Acyrthosiphon pisum]BAH72134.1 ACYPI010120 [Acyrthosiphon pisum]|eukprot:NP_001280284.1 non-histone protein 10 [Acyrthosiphon pisum]